MERQQTSLSSTKDPPRRIPISKASNPIHRYWWGETNITSSFTAKWSSTLLCKSWWEIRANKMVASGSPKLAFNYLLQGRNTKQLSKTQNPHLNWMIFWNFKPSPKSLKTHFANFGRQSLPNPKRQSISEGRIYIWRTNWQILVDNLFQTPKPHMRSFPLENKTPSSSLFGELVGEEKGKNITLFP